MLLFRFSGSFQFRLEVREYPALLYQEPPRTERFFSRRPAKDNITQNSTAVAIAAQCASMPQPAAEPLANRHKVHLALLKLGLKVPEAPTDTSQRFVGNPDASGPDTEAK